ncbi:hypothetical protein [Saccharicrinis aurantiacus]|uniref:hypothetical protein n=1 Tax=Saccharicrinis aurantiacus TaxID=1849719 RepID=UPI0009500A45|nr:hypothetical protein [Saccharicrinis aurantiacus]
MKSLKEVLFIGLVLFGLGFTSCSKDDDAPEPINPEQPTNPIAPEPGDPAHPIIPEGIQPV